MEEQETKSLKDTLASLEDDVKRMKTKGVKKFRMPFTGKVSNVKAKKGWVSICYIQDNLNVKFVRAPIKEGVITVDGTPHIALPEHILTYKNKPFIIVPTWSRDPFSPKANLKEAVDNESTSVGAKLIGNYLLANQIKPKMNVNWGMIIIGLIAIVGIGFYLLKSGVLK